MKYIIDVFDRELIYKLAYFLHGEIVNPTESLVIVWSDDEIQLSQEVEKIINSDIFRIEEYKLSPYASNDIDLRKLINWSELSRFIAGGDRNSIRPKYIPKKHYEALDKLFNKDLPEWWSGQKS